MNEQKIIEVQNLKKTFDQMEVLKGINLDVYLGDVIAIIGPSGSGKSTFLKCLNLLEQPDEGNILFNGKDIAKININDIRKDIGMVFQSFNLFENMNVLKNCTIAQTKVLKKNQKEAEETAINYLSKVGMADFVYADTKKLSGGQKQRVAIARALCMNPKVLLFDEPTSALDPEMVGEVLEVIKRLSKSGVTMIIVTHEMAFARDVASKVIFMSEGKIIEANTSYELFSNPQCEKTKQFLKRYNNL